MVVIVLDFLRGEKHQRFNVIEKGKHESATE